MWKVLGERMGLEDLLLGTFFHGNKLSELAFLLLWFCSFPSYFLALLDLQVSEDS